MVLCIDFSYFFARLAIYSFSSLYAKINLDSAKILLNRQEEKKVTIT